MVCIKPANIFVSSRGIAKILDFGVAKRFSAATQHMHGASLEPEHLTSPGTAVGTAAYMSPEQARGENLDARTDLFSLGVMLYEMATGNRPFDGDTHAVIFEAILNRPARPVREPNPKLPEKLHAIIHKALEKDRDLRYQHATDMRADLKRVQRDREFAEQLVSPRKPRHGLRAAVAAAALLVVLGGYTWLRRGADRPAEITERQITANATENFVTAAAISPDGKYIAYADRGGLFVSPTFALGGHFLSSHQKIPFAFRRRHCENRRKKAR